MGGTAPVLWSSDLGVQWRVLLDLLLALVLCTVIGVERELAAKSAGLRTHALVGVGSAAFMLVSKFGFGDLLGLEHVSLDPSRIAAQIVSGIGFIGGGLIFVRRDAVRGLTTAATVWVAAAVGAAAGAGLPLLAVAGTVVHYLITRGFRPLSRALARSSAAPRPVHVSYVDGRGVLRAVLTLCTERGFAVAGMTVDREDPGDGTTPRSAAVTLSLLGRRIPLHPLTSELAELPGVLGVRIVADEAEEAEE